MEYQIIVDPVSGSKNSIFSKKGIEIIIFGYIING